MDVSDGLYKGSQPRATSNPTESVQLALAWPLETCSVLTGPPMRGQEMMFRLKSNTAYETLDCGRSE